MFETNGKLNEKTIEELKICSINPKKKKFLKIFAVVYTLIGLFTIFLGLTMIGSFYVFVGLASILLAVYAIGLISYLQYKFKKDNIQALKEKTNKEEFEVRTFFNEKGVNIDNLTTSANIEIKYESFARLEETPNMYVLFTKSEKYVLVFKNCLNDKELKSFKEFIIEKCKNIK